MMQMNDPASSSQPICGIREVVTSSSVCMEPKAIKTMPCEIDADVLDHLPTMYQKMAAVFAASGKVVIVDNTSRGSRNE